MKQNVFRKVTAALCTIVLLLALLPPAYAADSPDLSAEAVYQAITALKSQYPDGTRWTNDNFYSWHGGIYSGGAGCAGFSMMLSDAAFATLPARKIQPVQLSDVRVGDILRVSNDTHSVIVL